MNNLYENDNEKDNKRFRVTAVCTLISCVFCAFLVLVMAIMILMPDKERSENENRMLEQKPSFSFSSFFNGSYMRDFEKYLTDQFPARNFIVSLKTSFGKLVGSRNENGVYFGSDGFLFEQQTPVDEEKLNTSISAINKFLKKKSSLRSAFILSPNSTYVLSDKLPYGHTEYDQKQILLKIKKRLSSENVSWIGCLSSFAKAENKEELFYRTDHHWTTRAAFNVFLDLSKNWNLKVNKKAYSFYTVSDTFAGTLSSYSGDRKIKDKLEICFPTKAAGTYTVFYESSQRKTVNLFESEKLNQKNQYEIFLGGNYDKVIISTTNQTGRSLLLFKDSYANCMIPMLTPFFEKIVVVDPRYFSDSLSALIKENDFTHILFLYNLNTFLSDSSLASVLES